MLAYLIDLSLKNRMLVLSLVLIMGALGVYSALILPIDAVPDLTKASPVELIKALENPNRHVRMSAQRLLTEAAGN